MVCCFFVYGPGEHRCLHVWPHSFRTRRTAGRVRFRHSAETNPDLALWQTSTSIGFAAKGDSLQAQLPLKPGTYLARVYDKVGRSSDVVALATKQASGMTFANGDTITAGTAFAGTHDGNVQDGDTLNNTGPGSFGD